MQGNLKDKVFNFFKIVTYISIGVLGFIGIIVFGFYNQLIFNNTLYLLYHTIVEFVALAIVWGISIIAWNTRKFSEGSFFLFLGISFVFMGVVDLLHTMSYKGMGIFIGYGANLPTQLWILGRFLQAISLLIAAHMFTRKINTRITFIGYGFATTFFIILIFVGIFPVCFVNGIGLTPFKRISEYIIIAILAMAAVLFIYQRKKMNRTLLILVFSAIIFTILSEFSFTLYVDVYGLFNLIGHYLKIVASFCLYKALIETTLFKPYDTLFRDLNIEKEELKTEKKFSESLLNAVVDTIFVFDPVSRKAHRWNKAMSEISGYTDEEISLMKAPDDWYNEEDLKIAAEVTEKIFEEGRGGTVMSLITKNKKKIPTEYTASLIKDNEGNPKYLIAVGRDITERQKSEVALQQAMTELATIFNTAGSGMRVVDKDGNVTRVNPAFSALIGSKSEELISQKCHEQFKGTQCNTPECALSRLLSGEEKIFQEVERKTPDGKEIPCLLVATPLKNAQGQIIGMVEAFTDITERKRLEALRSQNLSNVSHELRTPLTAINSTINNLIKYRQKLSNEQEEKMLTSISKNSMVINQMIEDLLNFSRFETGEITLEWRSYKPSEILREILLQLEAAWSEKEITIETEVDDALELFGDRDKIGQIFRIIIDNAIKYSAKNSKIRVKAIENYRGEYNSRELDGVLFEFADSGLGIRSTDIPNLFKRFFRSDDVRNIPGTGLGLSLARNLIQLHRGEIHAESTYGEGTCFYVFLPRFEQLPPEET